MSWLIAAVLLLFVSAGAQALPAAFSERADERGEMVYSQIEHGVDFRSPVSDGRVLEAMRKVPRHAFVPLELGTSAYRDTPLPIGHGQTISQPYIVALMTELLELTDTSKVLEVGTGSGYQAAVLAEITPHVFTTEIVAPLSERARQTLTELDYSTVTMREGDGYYGWPEAAPFDAIIVTCAAGHLPPALWAQLKPGGRIVIPIGSVYEVQRLVVIKKTPEGGRESRSVLDVRFVPMLHGRAE